MSPEKYIGVDVHQASSEEPALFYSALFISGFAG